MLKIRFTRQIALWSVLALGSMTGFVALTTMTARPRRSAKQSTTPADEIEDAVDKD